MSFEQMGSRMSRAQQVRESAFHMSRDLVRGGYGGGHDEPNVGERLEKAELVEAWLLKAKGDESERVSDLVRAARRVLERFQNPGTAGQMALAMAALEAAADECAQ
jgi:hypothetical protein